MPYHPGTLFDDWEGRGAFVIALSAALFFVVKYIFWKPRLKEEQLLFIACWFVLAAQINEVILWKWENKHTSGFYGFAIFNECLEAVTLVLLGIWVYRSFKAKKRKSSENKTA